MKRKFVKVASTEYCVTVNDPTKMVRGSNRNCPVAVILTWPAVGQLTARTRFSEVSIPLPLHPISVLTDGVNEYEYVSVDCWTTRDVLSHSKNGKLVGSAAAGARENGEVMHTRKAEVT